MDARLLGYAVLGAWLIQASVGVTLIVGWARHAHGSDAGPALAHPMLMVGYLAPWAVFLSTGAPVWAWIAFGVLFIGIPFGDELTLRRTRRMRGEKRPGLRDHASSIAMVFTGRLPPRLTFHALFSGVVFFGTVGVAIAATVAAV